MILLIVISFMWSTPMNKYLSIDIDFWNYTDLYQANNEINKLIYELLNRKVDIFACTNHQQMLQHVDDSDADLLINLDTHSDLADFTNVNFNCGTWASFVQWRRHGKYLWLHRSSTAEGECNIYEDRAEKLTAMFQYGTRSDLTDWEAINHRTITYIPWKLLLNNTVAAGFCLSPSYCTYPLEEIFFNIVSKYHLNYVKGERNEIDLNEIVKSPLDRGYEKWMKF